MQTSLRSTTARTLAWLPLAGVLGAGCTLEPFPDPVPGLPEYQLFGVVGVPGGLFNVAGRNLLLSRADVTVDTRIVAGTAIRATYSSATTQWHWSYETSYDGVTFVDPEGAVFDVTGIANGAAIPGTYWVRVDADTMKTKGGLSFDFDVEGRLAASYWSSDPHPQYRYVHDPAFVEQRECIQATIPTSECRLVFTVELGPSGPTRILDEESAKLGVIREALYSYDASGRIATARTPFEVDEDLPGTRYEYGMDGLVSAATDSEGSRIEYRFAFGWLAEVVQIGVGDPTHLFTYPKLMDEAASLYRVIHVNPLGGATWYTFTEAGHVTRVERVQAGEVMTIEWNEAIHRPTRIVGFDGTVRELQGYVDDDPTTVIEPSGNVVQITYAPAAVDQANPLSRAIATVTDSLGPVGSIVYDAAGRPLTVTNGEGETQTLAYYPGGEVSSQTAPWGGTTDFLSYGVHGHWRTAEMSWIPEVTIKRLLDPVGNLVVPGAGLQEGGVLQRAYDAARLVASVDVGATDEMGAVISTDNVVITRRSDGQMLSVIRPQGADHLIEYDTLGRVSRERERVDGVWRDMVYEYNALGQVSVIEKPNGMREEFVYDDYGRTLERRALRNGLQEAHALFEWTDGRLSRWYDSMRDQWETIDYDSAGRPEGITYTALGETLSYDYDVRSRKTRETYRLGLVIRVIEIEWNLADRRTRVFTLDEAGTEQDLVRLDYQQGRLVAIEYGNGLRRENLYDAAGRFAGYRTSDLVASAVVEETSITRESKAGPTRLEVTTWTETALATTQEQYWIGLGGNLQNPSSKIGSRVFRWQGWTWIDDVLQDEDQQVYAWDELSNRISDTDGNSFEYNAERNRLLSATVNGVSHAYTYDDAGYATSRDGMPIGWTAAGRLATVGPAGNPIAKIEWDLAGRPISASALGSTREFALFGGLVEYDAGTGQTGWLHITHVSLPFEGGERLYRHVDGLGNVSFITDEAGDVVSHRRYHPFGLDRVYGTGSFGEDDPHGFVGGIELRHNGIETGLVVLGARVLDSDVGRFLSQDPVFHLANAYTYAQGNPVQYEDPDGRLAGAKAAEAYAAQLEADAATLDAEAAELQTKAQQAFYVTAVLGLIGIKVTPVLFGAGAAAVVGARYSYLAAQKSERAAELRAEAAGVRLETGFDLKVPGGFELAAPPEVAPCSPVAAVVAADRILAWLVFALVTLLSVMGCVRMTRTEHNRSG